MQKKLPVLIAFVSSLAGPAGVQAGQQETQPIISVHAAVYVTEIVGVVKDELGRGLPDAKVLAVGKTLAAVRSDASGRFALALPAGDYILRASRDGYVSTYREAVRVQGTTALHRTITMLKADAAITAARPLPADPLPASSGASGDDLVPGEATWRLRHLSRTVLRDSSAIGSSSLARRGRDAWLSADRRSLAADLQGRVDLVTTSSMAVRPGSPLAYDLPKGVAYVAMGAPVGTRGEWLVRAALAVEEASAWTFLGEYRVRSTDGSAAHAGVSYSAQTVAFDRQSRDLAPLPTDVLRAASVHGGETRRLLSGLELEYDGRIDRFDYLADPNLLSGTASLRQRVSPRFSAVITASRRMVAPGADQFAPPTSAGAWLPPDRTFSALDSIRPIGAAEVDRAEFGVAVDFGRRREAARAEHTGMQLTVGHFLESTEGQIATLFGLDDKSVVGHYYVSAIGSPRVQGVAIGISGDILPRVTGRVTYVASETRWSELGQDGLRTLAHQAATTERRRGHDVTSALEGELPGARTRLTVALRINNGFLTKEDQDGPRARFAVHAEQPLALPSLAPDAVTLVLGARTLLGGVNDGRAYYDDLLTVAPPLRLTCGLQVRF